MRRPAEVLPVMFGLFSVQLLTQLRKIFGGMIEIQDHNTGIIGKV
jgi:hypothetical protein